MARARRTPDAPAAAPDVAPVATPAPTFEHLTLDAIAAQPGFMPFEGRDRPLAPFTRRGYAAFLRTQGRDDEQAPDYLADEAVAVDEVFRDFTPEERERLGPGQLAYGLLRAYVGAVTAYRAAAALALGAAGNGVAGPAATPTPASPART